MSSYRILSICLFLFFLPLFLRLFHLQVIRGEELRELSDDNRKFQKRLIASRGVITDRFGNPLVTNTPVYYRLLTPGKLFSQRELIGRDEAIQGLVSASESISVDHFRTYQYPDVLSSILGYVGSVTEEDLQRDDQLRIQQKIGKAGIERVFDEELRGVDGVETFETNAQGEVIRSLDQIQPTPGKTIRLTIDPELSQVAMQYLSEKKGAVVIGDANSGELLAVVTSPTFDANVFTMVSQNQADEQKKRLQISEYFANDSNIFLHRAFAGSYPPGSIFKLVTASVGLETQAIDEHTTVVDEGVLKVGDFQYGNWYYRQYGRVEGPIALVRAIARSNDIYFYKTAEWIGPERLAQGARMFGFGEKTSIELPAEVSGLVPDPAWKERVIGERWFLGNTYHYGIGQGDLLVTPVQAWAMTSVFANHGKLCMPHIVHDVQNKCKELSISDEHLSVVTQGMVEACSTGGTAYPFFSWNEEHEEKIGCKTGTAEFGSADAQGHRKTHAWFTMNGKLAESTDFLNYPRNITMTVLVESDEAQPFAEGSRESAPIALEIWKWMVEHR